MHFSKVRRLSKTSWRHLAAITPNRSRKADISQLIVGWAVALDSDDDGHTTTKYMSWIANDEIRHHTLPNTEDTFD